ncbi:phosphotransferase [Caballeronia sp. 15715]|uniref:phosphotransferase n=1 Tax=Caballeronia sp. 15715 TaxID=3391030 RepID=UPI0039E2B29D
MSEPMAGQYAGTTEVQERNRFDVAALEGYLAQHIEGFAGPLDVSQFKGGQSNPTFLLSVPAKRYVLRKKPSGVLLPSAHAVEREYRVIKALDGTDVPVARSRCLCEDASIIGTPFYVMDHVEGRILWNPTLPGFEPAVRAAMFDEMNRVVSALHRVDVNAVGLQGYGRPGGYIERQVGRWVTQYRAAVTEPIDAMDRLIEWLPQHLPPEEVTTVVHGDLRLDNMIFHPTEPRVVAVLDWELSTLGDPLSDLAYHMLTWYLTAEEFRGMAGDDLAALGIPDVEPYLARYCERTGRAEIDPARWNFYVVFNMFRLAAILQGIAKRAVEGNAANATARETGALARPIAEVAWQRAAATAA